MWPFTTANPGAEKPPLYLTNTLGGDKQLFESPEGRPVRMYNCGPTVYDRQHIGNLSMFVFTDILRRTLEYNDLSVKQIINITDVGHLSSDADEGEDKMTKGLQREGLDLTLENMRTMGEKYAELFKKDLEGLNVEMPEAFPYASDYIEVQVRMIQTLVEKGYAYEIEDGVYFDTTAFPEYGKLGGIDLEKLKEGARVEVNAKKRHPADFALWKKNEKLGWDSPWGKGFPGWHIECSAMARDLLGEQIDIHTGGVEHISIHHNNEIAQSEAATGKKPFVRIWMHRAHVQFDGGKMAKSEGNIVYLSDIVEKGFHPLAYRYLLLGAHYRTPLNFTWEALAGARQAVDRLRSTYASFSSTQNDEGSDAALYRTRFHERINDDIDTPGALAVVWDMVRDTAISAQEKKNALDDFDRVLGLKFGSDEFETAVPVDDLPEEVQKLVQDREEARLVKNWIKADDLREEIRAAGYEIEDTTDGPRVTRV